MVERKSKIVGERIDALEPMIETVEEIWIASVACNCARVTGFPAARARSSIKCM